MRLISEIIMPQADLKLIVHEHGVAGFSKARTAIVGRSRQFGAGLERRVCQALLTATSAPDGHNYLANGGGGAVLNSCGGTYRGEEYVYVLVDAVDYQEMLTEAHTSGCLTVLRTVEAGALEHLLQACKIFRVRGSSVCAVCSC
jgi:hypothetical protein